MLSVFKQLNVIINAPPKWLIRAHYPPDQYYIAGGFFLHMDVLMLGGHGRQRAVFVQIASRKNRSKSMDVCCLFMLGLIHGRM